MPLVSPSKVRTPSRKWPKKPFGLNDQQVAEPERPLRSATAGPSYRGALFSFTRLRQSADFANQTATVLAARRRLELAVQGALLNWVRTASRRNRAALPTARFAPRLASGALAGADSWSCCKANTFFQLAAGQTRPHRTPRFLCRNQTVALLVRCWSSQTRCLPPLRNRVYIESILSIHGHCA